MNFWLEERDLPPGCGFSPWGAEHVTMMLVIALFTGVMIIWFHRLSSPIKVLMLRIIALLLPVFEIWKIVMLTVSGRMGVGHLPLHLCSMAIYMYPITALAKHVRLREALAEIGLITLFPAAFSTILFPDWTMYPMLNFYCLHAFLWHTLQMLFPVLCLMNGWCRPKLRHLWMNTLFLLIGAALIGWFDRRTSCNYWFLRWPVPGTPLQWLHDAFGARGYPVSLLALATIVNLLMYGLVLIGSNRRKRRDTVRTVRKA